ncbi:BlaI/MecI/CopY family transcriptional regulator [Hathewaya histolytica]|uniref:BlaI/MecI/CopY family transcriptional regulator n=1 Tax=Hathewaya histolytica TaxID=1498 RepID=UPI003B66B79A
MKIRKIPESELEVMKVIWNKNSFISSKEIALIMEEKMNWKRTTTLTLLSRLAEKGFIDVEKGKKITYYMAIITEEEYVGVETSSFFSKLHKNSLKSFITTLHDNNDITEKDLDELKEWIKNR